MKQSISISGESRLRAVVFGRTYAVRRNNGGNVTEPMRAVSVSLKNEIFGAKCVFCREVADSEIVLRKCVYFIFWRF